MSNIKKAVFITVVICGFLIGFGGALVYRISRNLPSVDLLETYRALSSKVYDRNKRIIYEFYEEKRIPVKLENIPAPIIKATLALEDKNFYKHHGFDISGFSRAIILNAFRLRSAQGGSTITQQLARNLFLTFDKSILRKLKELILALRIERIYSKDEILELYFNQIYYGNGAYGIETAAQTYFGKHVNQLKLYEYALLIGLPKNPAKYNPYTNLENATGRRNLVISVLAQSGVVSKEEEEAAKKVPIKVFKQTFVRGTGAYFIEEIRKWVSAQFGADELYRGGILIYTTLDGSFQQAADSVVKNGLMSIGTRFKSRDTTLPLQTALLVMDPNTGGILAEVGGKEFGKSMFNRAIQGERQAGSAFKPFVWTAALESGYTPASVVEDAPIAIKDWGNKTYRPGNYDEDFLGPITLRKALALSRNLVSVRLIMDIGPEKVISYARRMGITSKLDPVISLSLGCSSISLLDMVTAYGTFATGGIRVTPYMIEKITDLDGSVLYKRPQLFKDRVLSPQTAYLMTSMLQSVVNEGTGIKIRNSGLEGPIAGKTGTSDEYGDTWFIGFTPDIV
ncbi:MAG: PBP1A family penicillin-binding protein, partial [bacterium]|nr:PBP1A family penicillin-binding protein [bacterium]